MFPLLLKGFSFGLALAAPVGPIALLCLRRAIAFGRLAGFASGLGAATADATYAALASTGLSALATPLQSHARGFQIGGGLALFLIGLAGLRPKTAPAHDTPQPGPAARHSRLFLTTFGLTLANPLTIVTFAGLTAALGLAGAGNLPSATVLTLGVFAGSAAWWWLLATAAHWFRGHLTHGAITRFNRFCNLAIAVFGLWQALSIESAP